MFQDNRFFEFTAPGAPRRGIRAVPPRASLSIFQLYFPPNQRLIKNTARIRLIRVLPFWQWGEASPTYCKWASQTKIGLAFSFSPSDPGPVGQSCGALSPPRTHPARARSACRRKPPPKPLQRSHLTTNRVRFFELPKPPAIAAPGPNRSACMINLDLA